MKQLIILILLIIAFIIGYGKYNQYKRYNSPEVNYKTDKKIDLEYHNQEMLISYYNAIENLNSFVMMQWTVNGIDVRTPEDDDEQTKLVVGKYSKKLANIKYFESKLEKSSLLKEKGLSNNQIIHLEKTGIDLKTYKESIENNKIKKLFDSNKKINYGQKSVLIYEVQKKLVSYGIDIKVDGVFKIATLNAIKTFEEKNNLFPDGNLDRITLDLLFK